jgi:glutamyl/glutaminyl-tRNA synthetase
MCNKLSNYLYSYMRIPFEESHFTRTRIAPTPSGFLHLGNVFSFALTASLARKTGATILLRIDDLDQPRIQPQYVQDIFDTLQFLDITWQEGPENYEEYENKFSQLKRMPLYEKALNQLREGNQVFACSCSRTNRNVCNCREKNLSLDETGNAWRLITPASAELPDSMHEFIVRKKDGFPSYQLGCVADDEHFGVDLIVRGDDLRDSSKAQVYLAKVLGYTSFLNSTILHHPLLMESPDQKLSKSAGSTSIQHLRQQGKSPNEIFELISKMTGAATPVNRWENLADTVDFH